MQRSGGVVKSVTHEAMARDNRPSRAQNHPAPRAAHPSLKRRGVFFELSLILLSAIFVEVFEWQIFFGTDTSFVQLQTIETLQKLFPLPINLKIILSFFALQNPYWESLPCNNQNHINIRIEFYD